MKLTVRLMLSGALLCSTLVAARADLGVVVVAKDGSITSMTLPEVQRIDIGSEQIVLHSSESSTTIAHADLDHIKIGADVTGVQKLLKYGEVAVWPSHVTDYVNVAGLADNTPVNIYSISGTRAASATAADGSARLDLSGATPGVYIVKAGDISVKIIKE